MTICEYDSIADAVILSDFVKFACSLNKNKIQLRMSITFKDHFFYPGEYPYLKEIYDLYVEKRQEQIVLKKKT